MKTKRILFILFLVNLFIPKDVFSESNIEYMITGDILEGVYIKQVADIGLTWATRAEILKRKSDNQWVYGIEPGMEAKENSIYETFNENFWPRSQISDEEWEKIKLIAYYGYNYQENNYDHSDPKWYAVTQILIWRTVRPKWDIYFTDIIGESKFDGEKLEDKFIDELNELKFLVNNHFKLPNFDSYEFKTAINDSITIIDQNNVLNDFQIRHEQNLNITKINNEIKISFNNLGYHEIELYKEFNKYSNVPLIYNSDTYQNTISVGKLEELSTKISFLVHTGEIQIQMNNENNLNNKKINIYNANNELVKNIIIDDNGLVKIDFLSSYGKYYLLEEADDAIASKKYFFDVNKDNINTKIIIESDSDIRQTNNEIIKVSIPKTGFNTINIPIYKITLFIYPNKILYEKKKYY